MKLKTSHVVVGGLLLLLLLRKKQPAPIPVIAPGPVVRPGTPPVVNVLPSQPGTEPAVSGFETVCYPNYHQVI